MTDYYSLIACAIAGLETRESRLAVYEQAQAALLEQLHTLDPPLADSEIAREHLLLAEAIREVEAGCQRCIEKPRQQPRSEREPENTCAVDDTAGMSTHIADPGRGPPPLTAEASTSLRKSLEAENLEPFPPLPTSQAAELAAADPSGSSKNAVIAAFLGLFVVVALAVTLYSLGGPLNEAFIRSPADQTASSENRPSGNQSGTTAAVRQRVVLSEGDPADAQAKRYVGSVIWHTEAGSPTTGQSSDLAVKADLEIPERRINMKMSLRRNTDKELRASHTVEIIFNLPTDFPFGGIADLSGIMMRQAELARAAPLAGLTTQVISGFFLVGLSVIDSDMQRNLEMLKAWSWFDIPVVYNNGRRANLEFEKGTFGERSFAEAFTAWGQ
jgi:hypothetical protein